MGQLPRLHGWWAVVVGLAVAPAAARADASTGVATRASAASDATTALDCPLDEQGRPRPRDTLDRAARCLDLPAVRRFVDVERADVNSRAEDGRTALQAALLSYGAWDRLESRALSDRRAQVLSYLLARGADPRAQFEYGGVAGLTPLHVAAYDGKLRYVRLLVKAGARIDAQDARGFTPLHLAARCDFRLSSDAASAATIDYLVSRGAGSWNRSLNGETPLERVPTPCAAPGQCTDAELAGPWPSGTCRQAYRSLHRSAYGASWSKAPEGAGGALEEAWSRLLAAMADGDEARLARSVGPGDGATLDDLVAIGNARKPEPRRSILTRTAADWRARRFTRWVRRSRDRIEGLLGGPYEGPVETVILFRRIDGRWRFTGYSFLSP